MKRLRSLVRQQHRYPEGNCVALSSLFAQPPGGSVSRGFHRPTNYGIIARINYTRNQAS
ncbi:MAG TPA: hypothetical protein V6D48_24045 [Oculatellaceae cyanobacterium]